MRSEEFEMVRSRAKAHMDAAFEDYRALLKAVPEDYRTGLGNALIIVDRALRDTIESAADLARNPPA